MKKHIVEIWKEHSVGRAIFLTLCAVVGWLVAYFGVMCLKSLFVMLLWNWVAVGLFGAPTLTFWIAFGLQWLCSLLFKNKTIVDRKSKN
jgi:hypothetical protein